MAQTGYTPILIYSSSTASQAPLAANLTNSTLGSELAININDGKLFYKDSGGAVQVIAWKTTPTTAGGTGLTSYTAGDLVYYASGTTLSKLAIGTAYYQLGVNAGGTAPAWQPSATSVLTTQGDLLYASAANTLARLAKNTTASRYLSNSGTSNNPAWSQIDLTNGVTGTLPIANGGTNQTSFTSPASSIAGLTYFDGTSLVNNGTPSRLGFNATSNTFYGNTIVSGSANALFAGISGYTPQIQTHAGDTNSSGFGIFAFTAGGVGRYQINRSKSTTIGTNSALASGDVVGILQFGGADGTSYIDCADIRAYVDGAVSTNTVPGRLSFFVNPGGGAVNPVEAVRLDSSYNLTMYYGNIVQGTAAKGINFTANSAAAGMTSQLLNWYEEGSWTPTISGSTSAGTGTYTTQVGRYTRIGNRVMFSCYVVWTAHTGTGNARLTNFPFTSANVSGLQQVFSVLSDTITFSNSLTVWMTNNQTFAYIGTFSSGANNASLPMTNAAAGSLYVSGQYQVA